MIEVPGLPRIDDTDNSEVLSRCVLWGAHGLVAQYDAAVGYEKVAVRERMRQFRAVTLARLAGDIAVPVAPERLDRVRKAVKDADELVAEALTRS